MSKRKQYRQAQQEVFDAKIFYAKVLKRYGIMLAITVPIILAVNFLLSYLMPESYQGAVVYVVIFVILFVLYERFSFISSFSWINSFVSLF